jgi:hypothetical protein
MGRLSRFLRLPASEKRLFLRSFAWLLAVRFGLSLLPFGMVLRLQKSVRASNGRSQRLGPETIEEVSRAVDRASRFVPGARCLAQALTAQILLARRGIPTELRIGVAREEGGPVRAHAWLEGGGKVLFERAHPEVYRALSSFPRESN